MSILPGIAAPTANSKRHIIPGGGLLHLLTRDSSSASADPEEQTQDHDGKKAEEEHQPDHDDDHFDRSPPAHHAPTKGVNAALRRIAGSPPGPMAASLPDGVSTAECAGSPGTANYLSGASARQPNQSGTTCHASAEARRARFGG